MLPWFNSLSWIGDENRGKFFKNSEFEFPKKRESPRNEFWCCNRDGNDRKSQYFSFVFEKINDNSSAVLLWRNVKNEYAEKWKNVLLMKNMRHGWKMIMQFVEAFECTSEDFLKKIMRAMILEEGWIMCYGVAQNNFCVFL